ncbi:MAG TPA: helix-turn-helix domain-containing protein, partial [Solirubrobacterales bacterium]|nr:helix-turn-helix domain-containing protein [Solirubrobacterales bacterium]
AERYGEPTEDGVVITLPISQEELAGWTGSSRESVAQALSSLRGLGAIRTERRKIIVRDAEALGRQSA